MRYNNQKKKKSIEVKGELVGFKVEGPFPPKWLGQPDVYNRILEIREEGKKDTKTYTEDGTFEKDFPYEIGDTLSFKVFQGSEDKIAFKSISKSISIQDYLKEKEKELQKSEDKVENKSSGKKLSL